jgi:hypothetical protein
MKKVRRPGFVTLVVGLGLIFTALNWLRLVLAIQNWDVVAGRMVISPAFLAISGLIWGLVGLGLAAALWLGKPWAPLAACMVALIYSAYYWAIRLVPPGYTGRNANWPFALGANLLVLAWMVWSFSRPKVKSFYGPRDLNGEKYEHRSEN